MLEKLNIAVIGAGAIAQDFHLPSLQRLSEEIPALYLCALCDVNEDRARQASERFGFARHYQDYRQMLEVENPAAVWLLVPYQHEILRNMAADMLERHVTVLIEKPPAETSEEVRGLAEIARRTGTPHQVAFNRRHAPLLKQMKALADDAGGMRLASCQFYRTGRSDLDFSYSTALHGLDTLRFLSGSEVRKVFTQAGSGTNRLVTLFFDNGASAIMEIFPQVGIQSERYTVHAGERTLVVDGNIAWLTYFPGFLQCFEGGRLVSSLENPAGSAPEEVSGFYGESAHFVECLLQGKLPSPGLADAVRSIEIAEAVDRGQSLVF